jgi:hypothetical protein
MSRVRLSAALGLVLALAAPAVAEPTLKAGKYKLAFHASPSATTNYWILDIKEKNGDLSGTLTATAPGPALAGSKLTSFNVANGEVRAALEVGMNKTPVSFEGKITKDGTKALGSLVIGAAGEPRLAELQPTQASSIAPNQVTSTVKVPAPYTKAAEVRQKVQQLYAQAERAQDEAQQDKLAGEARKEAASQLPKLYREVLDKHHENGPALFDSALALLRRRTAKLEAGDAKKWLPLLEKKAEEHGKRWKEQFDRQLIAALANRKDTAALVLEKAKAAVDGLPEKAPLADQLRALETYEAALHNSGKADDAKKVAERVTEVNKQLDKEYDETMGELRGAKVTRKGNNDRVTVMELFTGSQCPPCVAADFAFDALAKAYQPTEAVFLEYHLHVPGPDPLTNWISAARAAYYGIGGTPTTLFNGKSEKPGGGGRDDAQEKYEQYCTILDIGQRDVAEALLKATATRDGDKVTVTVEVDKMLGPDEHKRLRVFLVEESVRYAGSNGVRFHHHVVRDMPGGLKGIAMTKRQGKYTVTSDLKAVRKRIARYLEDYEEDRGTFSATRPLVELKKLKVIAIIQDDETKEVIQGTQAKFADKK